MPRKLAVKPVPVPVKWRYLLICEVLGTEISSPQRDGGHEPRRTLNDTKNSRTTVVGQFELTDFRNLEDFGSLGLD